MQQNIIGVRFQEIGKIYHFSASNIPELEVGDFVIVETNRGRQIGQVVNFFDDDDSARKENLKPVEALATPRDLVLRQLWRDKEAEALVKCREYIQSKKNPDVKVISAEYSYDGKRITFTCCSVSEEKIELKNLRKELNKKFGESQVELRQVGPRDVAKAYAGLGACGLNQRCCAKFLSEFSPISIKMAKEQGISLTPDEITGICGRLRCCLMYEYEQYISAKNELPKKGKRVVTPVGEGKVTNLIPLQHIVTVSLTDVGERNFHREELEPWDELEMMRRKSQSPEAITEKEAEKGKPSKIHRGQSRKRRRKK